MTTEATTTTSRPELLVPAPPETEPTTTTTAQDEPSSTSDDGLSPSSKLGLAVAGLLIIAALVGAVTVVYFLRTRPEVLPEPGTDDGSASPSDGRSDSGSGVGVVAGAGVTGVAPAENDDEVTRVAGAPDEKESPVTGGSEAGEGSALGGPDTGGPDAGGPDTGGPDAGGPDTGEGSAQGGREALARLLASEAPSEPAPPAEAAGADEGPPLEGSDTTEATERPEGGAASSPEDQPG